MIGSVGRVEQMLEWNCLMSIKDMAQSTGERIIVDPPLSGRHPIV